MGIVFIDFEATSLTPESKPIEVALCDECGAVLEMVIRPEAAWTDWSVASATVHGITRAELQTHGVSANTAADRVFDILLEADNIYSDHPDHDAGWLAELLRVGGYAPRGFRLQDVAELYREACEPLRLRDGQPAADDITKNANDAEDRRVRQRHRAGPDAYGLWWTWQEIKRLLELAGL